MRLDPSIQVVSKSEEARQGSGLSPVEFSDSSPMRTRGVSPRNTAHLQTTDLNEQRHKRMVMEIQLHLITERLPGRIGEHIRSQHLVDNIERSHNGEFLIHFRPMIRISKLGLSTAPIEMNLQALSFVKIHAVA